LAAATLLLPPASRFGAQALPVALARALGRADAMPAGHAGTAAQLLRHFELLPRGWPVAALTRSIDASDAASAQWLRADPAWVRPDINGARLFATGDGLGLTREDADALLPSLRTLFGDAGFPIDAPSPARWYLRLPHGSPLPAFAAPEDALGTDLFDALVGTDPSRDAPGRRWRSLLSDAQVILHNHPWNAQRAQRGLAPVNSLWFWGGGALPDHVSTPFARVQGDDVLLRALATRAGVASSAVGGEFEAPPADALVDLREARDIGPLSAQWLLPALAALRRGTLDALVLDFADGRSHRLLGSHRWRFWRKPASLR
jgi:hypothetical protein